MNSFTESLTGVSRILWYLLCGFAFFGAWLFPLMYLWVSDWQKTEMGRHLMTFSTAVAYALTAYLSRVVWGDYPGRNIVMFSALLLLIFATWWRAIIFIRMRRKDRRRDEQLV